MLGLFIDPRSRITGNSFLSSEGYSSLECCDRLEVLCYSTALEWEFGLRVVGCEPRSLLPPACSL